MAHVSFLVLLYTCEAYRHRREECERTWLKQWSYICPVLWVYGGAKYSHFRRNNELHVACPETWEALPLKTRATMSFIWAHRSNNDLIVKADDDTFIHLARLQYALEHGRFGSRKYSGCIRDKNFARVKNNNITYCHGGAGYVLNMEAVEKIAWANMDWTKEKIEDGAVSKALRIPDEGEPIYPHHDPRFCSSMEQGIPKPGNEIITTHRCTGRMEKILEPFRCSKSSQS